MAPKAAASCLLPPITDLSSDGDSSHAGEEVKEVVKRKAKKRFRDGPKLKERLTDPQAAKSLASRVCGGNCRKLCLKQFQRGEMFTKLMDFRKHLSELHKLDADRLVPRLASSNDGSDTTLGPQRWVYSWHYFYFLSLHAVNVLHCSKLTAWRLWLA